MSALAAEGRGRSIVTRLTVREKALERRMLRRLEQVEIRLLECAREADDPRLAAVVGHLIAAGGKRMRPLLTLLGAEFGDPQAAGVLEAAVFSELIHTASLHHDDVMDEALIRHGVTSVNARWGNRVAVRSGNWLLAKAAQLSAGLSTESVPLQAEASQRLVQGQLRELVGPALPEDRLSHYFGVISDKSASLISLSLRLGAVQAGAPAQVSDALAEYGEQLGVAFQISDDVLDIVSPSADLGKEQGKDLAVGVAGLPVLLVLEGVEPEDDELRALLSDPAGVRGDRHVRALALLQRSEAMSRARALMDGRLAGARAALASLPPGPPRKALDALCDFVATRTA
ncbi:polyprenyl diphosphate synthase [Streptomyces sp. WAC 01529]|uniref:polyprenyl synthetase family protein n=1 Tax=Streptomyces sp. WAC 01529 TaxID=2203205 RepID=UPI000F714B3A|nr:polyprenyl synthetase family protein [Streptomyces sp. WAC 01529]AZM56537.1 polyprenyl diphosphate synthase [Streptomyces sp. WAC 01529]